MSESLSVASTELVDSYPFTPQTQTVNGFRLSYLDEGSGDPVVMLHGNPTWSFYYRELVLALRNRFRCIAPDHIGCGLSEKPSADDYSYSLEQRVADLDHLLDQLQVTENVTLVLHDWGGMIGMIWATRHPDRVKRIIASNTAAFPLPSTQRFPRSLWWGRNTRLGAWLILHRNAFVRAAASWCVTRRPLALEARAGLMAPYNSPENRIAVLKFVQTIPLEPSDPGYDLIQSTAAQLKLFQGIPLLLLWGMRDFVFTPTFLAEWQRYFPSAETHTWPDCGHYLLEDAHEEVIPQIEKFLSRHPIGM